MHRHLLALLAAGCHPSPHATANRWAALAQRDLDAIHASLLANHPGPVDAKNPGFRAWLEDGYRKAGTLARDVTSFGGMRHVLELYAAGFRDGHLGVVPSPSPTQAESGPSRWPGFLVARRGPDYVVAESVGGELPPNDAVLTSCDGIAPETILRRDIFPYTGDPELDASWTRTAPLLLADDDNPFRHLPQRCEIRTGTTSRTYDLQWRTIAPSELDARISHAAFGDPPVFATHTRSDGTVWVAVPSFDTRDAAKLEATIDALPAARTAPVIVFDVRGNPGGNSEWGSRIVRALYGEGATATAWRRLPQIVVEWRASSANAAFVAETAKTQGPQLGPDAIKYYETLAANLHAAAAAGAQTYIERDDDASSATPLASSEPLTHAHVYVLTDARCASACLDFLDVLLVMPGVTHIGVATSADTQYMDGRVETLPSGLFRLGFAMKVLRNRQRDRKALVPHVVFAGDIRDTEAVARWITTLH
jgi:hypothetical protein